VRMDSYLVGGGGGGVVEQAGGRQEAGLKGSGGQCCVFSVTGVPPSCKVEVLQSVGGRACRIFQSGEGVLSREMEVRVSNRVSLLFFPC
jgi:hypothetical protein